MAMIKNICLSDFQAFDHPGRNMFIFIVFKDNNDQDHGLMQGWSKSIIHDFSVSEIVDTDFVGQSGSSFGAIFNHIYRSGARTEDVWSALLYF